ncbi:ABC transporter substrate-binding protein [Modestobacter sp. VKM Ac-2979]|uniref:siderophore ABC transporter substrate-binding protein n=1 Tax=unclassified Modestobacter TaxID=2643866 RepID=UPI0022ABAA41|nr:MULTISPECIES: ABC transporter substrate-binding protein [unclassified Modestobacter]MCZ2810983.1 ABC transporter substrate-binding protein [Modestobacter sp. VKM Ac-2979]MCZ2840496.1 ABC transporter substrate-binding protein [Modestobacter sp. VKM Ac-2980]
MRTTSRPLAGAALSLSVLLALAACGDDAATDAAAADESAAVSFTWDRNTAAEDQDPQYEETTVEVPKDPEDIVVFDMASLDTIGALGGEVSGAPLDDVPDYLQDSLTEDAYDVGTLFEADLVGIEAQQPDLIVVAGRSAALYEDLSEIAPTVDLSMRGSFTETLERNTTFLGEVLGAEDEAAAAVEEIEAGIEEARQATADAGTGLGLMVSGGKLSALAPAGEDSGGRGARGGLIYDTFGVQPVVQDVEAATHGEPVSFEFLLETNPDHLWVIDRDAAIGEQGGQAAAAVLDNGIVAQTTAAQQDQIHYLDPQAWYIVYGGIETTRIMIDDVLQIAD